MSTSQGPTSGISEEAKRKLAASLGGNQAGASAASVLEEQDEKATGNDVTGEVARVLEATTGIEREEISERSRLDGDLNVDSLSKVDTAVRLEEKFGVRIEEEDILQASTVGDLVTLIERKQGEQKRGDVDNERAD